MALSIPLPILLGLIVGGIGGTIGALYAMGWATPARISDTDAAIERFSLDYPDDTVTEAVVDTHGSSALLLLEDATLVLVSVLGDRFVVRKLRAGSIGGLRIEPTHLELSLNDLTFPAATIQLEEGETRALWLERLSSCTSTALAS